MTSHISSPPPGPTSQLGMDSVAETDRPDGLSAGRVRPAHDFDAIYASGTPPWEIGRPQPAFLGLANADRLVGRTLDVGCGTGEHALMAAAIGLEATGLDALALESLNEHFDTVLDCGLFHGFDDDERSTFVDGLRASVPSGGYYYMLC